MQTFTPAWENWIDLNLQMGNCKQIMFQKSLEAGYSYDLVKQKIGIDYAVAAVASTNPLQSSGVVALRTAQKLNAKNLEIYRIDNFLTQDECNEIIAIINSSGLTTSATYDATNPNERVVNAHRTSQTCCFEGPNPRILEFESRICKTIGINNRQAEQIQGQKYQVGQEFKFHADYFDSEVMKQNASIIGQRTWTFMIYLNDVEEGGYTSFPLAFYSSAPKMGSAMVWNNLYSSATTSNVADFGKVNPFSSHCGMPIIRGEKYILTKWFKENEHNLSVTNEICEHHFFPTFHPVGFEKMRLKLECVDAIKQWLVDHDNVENTNDGWINENLACKEEAGMIDKTEILNVNAAPAELMNNFQDTFKNLLTKWIEYKTPLVHSSTYGIRKYLRGSYLMNHYDRPKTHIISAIIHLGDVSDKPWNLYIEDHHFRPHNVTMEYGDILLYESTTCLHGRPVPFEGTSHCNMYIHFKPERW